MSQVSILQKKNKTIKNALIFAACAGLGSGVLPAYAVDLSSIDFSQKSYVTPTLEYLKSNNIPVISSGYKLTKIEGYALPINSELMYEVSKTTTFYHPETGNRVYSGDIEDGVQYKTYEIPTMTNQYYSLDLVNTEYGVKSGASSVEYYNWGCDWAPGMLFFGMEKSTTPSFTGYITNYVNSKTDPNALSLYIDNEMVLPKNVDGSVDKISGGFIGNVLSGSSIVTNYAGSGDASIDVLSGYFITNESTSADAVRGGAISNISTGSYTAKIGDIVGDFIGNHIGSSDQMTQGGAIYNAGNIDNIVGDFIRNTASSSTTNYSQGGAIYNSGNITNIMGSFLRNSVGQRIDDGGGAIYNSGIISSIVADFSDNSGYFGGAVFNSGVITTLKADYYANYGFYGAVYNSGKIGTIEGDFVDNKGYYVSAIFNDEGGKIDKISGDFIGSNFNYSGNGNVILNQLGAEIGTIDAVFANNKGSYVIENKGGLINSIISDFISNSAGAINNYGTVNLIDGLFMSNAGSMGVVVNKKGGIIKELKSDFLGNNTSAVYNEYGLVESIVGDFVSNSGKGVINHYGAINFINASFIGNKTKYSMNSPLLGSGAAIHNNRGVIDLIMGDFIENATSGMNNYGALGGAIYNYSDKNIDPTVGIIKEIRADFIANSAYANDDNPEKPKNAFGGAIYNSGTIDAIVNSSFHDNYAKANYGRARGGAIYSSDDMNIVADKGVTEFTGNYVENGNSVDAQAIYMASNYVVDEQQKRTAILSTLNLEAKNNGIVLLNDKISGEANVITNKYQIAIDQVTKEEIRTYVDDQGSKITDPSLYTYDSYKINFKGDNTGKIILNNNIEAESFNSEKGVADMNLYSVTLHLGSRDNVLDGNNLNLHSGTLSLVNNQVGTSHLNTLNIQGETSMHVDVDLKSGTMDTLKADYYDLMSNQIKVTGMNLLKDAPAGKDITDIYFADAGLKDNVSGGGEIPNSFVQTTAYTPIYKYNITYDNRADAGYFVFAKGDKVLKPIDPSNPNITPIVPGSGTGSESTGNLSDAFNPAVLASPIAAQAGVMSTIGQTFNYAFQNSDNYMATPYSLRMSMRNANKYALAVNGDATDVGTYSPLFTRQDSGSVWVKPYASFSNVGLKNGPKVSNITYGTIIGFDTEIEHLKRGWDRVWTGYVGYNGSSQRYSGVDVNQTGGMLGATMTLYKGNFFNATSLTTGASVAFASNMYGNEHFSMLYSGIANKTGYNIEFKDGKVILQPSMLLGYSFVNTFDYANSAGVKIDAKPLHSIQLIPGMKLIANLKNGWQPYASVNMIWNVMGETETAANNVNLPQMSVKPYVQYGVGIQKTIKDRCMAFGQAMVQNGGRNGVLLSLGFRWTLGKDTSEKKEKVSKPQNKIAVSDNSSLKALASNGSGPKVLKQMNSVQRAKYLK